MDKSRMQFNNWPFEEEEKVKLIINQQTIL